jgi:chromosome partitioning protein
MLYPAPVPSSTKPAPATIASFNLKGGVGKTHLCWLLASVCIERRKRCLIVDLDQQANITLNFLPEHHTPTGVERIFDSENHVEPSDLIRRTQFEQVDLIPVTGEFARLDLAQGEAWREQRLHTMLADVLSEIASDYDFILLDCPPRVSLSSYAALCAADFVVVPLEAADWGARGTGTVRAVIERVQAEENPSLELLGYVVSKFKKRREFQNTYLTEIKDAFGTDVFKTMIPDLATFERSVDEALPTTLHSPRSHAASVARNFYNETVARIAAAKARKGLSRREGSARPRAASFA